MKEWVESWTRAISSVDVAQRDSITGELRVPDTVSDDPDYQDICMRVATTNVPCFTVSVDSLPCFTISKWEYDPDDPMTHDPVVYPPTPPTVDLSGWRISKVYALSLQLFLFLSVERELIDEHDNVVDHEDQILKLRYTRGIGGGVGAIVGVDEVLRHADIEAAYGGPVSRINTIDKIGDTLEDFCMTSAELVFFMNSTNLSIKGIIDRPLSITSWPVIMHDQDSIYVNENTLDRTEVVPDGCGDGSDGTRSYYHTNIIDYDGNVSTENRDVANIAGGSGFNAESSYSAGEIRNNLLFGATTNSEHVSPRRHMIIRNGPLSLYDCCICTESIRQDDFIHLDNVSKFELSDDLIVGVSASGIDAIMYKYDDMSPTGGTYSILPNTPTQLSDVAYWEGTVITSSYANAILTQQQV